MSFFPLLEVLGSFCLKPEMSPTRTALRPGKVEILYDKLECLDRTMLLYLAVFRAKHV